MNKNGETVLSGDTRKPSGWEALRSSVTPIGRPIFGSVWRIFQRIWPGFYRHDAGRGAIRVVPGSGNQRLQNRRLGDGREMDHTNRPLRSGCRARFDVSIELAGGCRDVIAVLI